MDNAYFFSYMRNILGERYGDFEHAYNNKPRFKALRVNTLKISVEEFSGLYGELKRNPLCDNSFYSSVKPSLDPLYHAGLYYMQEPSAAAAVAAFKPFIGERVLDLCAAPGGKSSQVAEHMRGGVLFCNDPEPKRVRALAENVERLGVGNAVVTCRTAADYVAAGFSEYFDTLVLDAPCSGGGMMRYECVPYSEEIVRGCSERQRAIIADAVKLLCGGGYMLYSTCTFAKEENEDNIAYLKTLGMRTVDIPLLDGAERGIGEPHARRIYPHNFDGEGHFYCVLQKQSGGKTDLPPLPKKIKSVRFGGAELFVAHSDMGGVARDYLPFDPPECSALRPIRLGVGTPDPRDSRERYFEACYALGHALSSAQVAAFGAVEAGENASAYIRGEQLDAHTDRKGYVLVTTRGYVLGAGYCAADGSGGAAIKNGYPKRLRNK